jgi:short-subunit dehydrogenase
MDLAGKVVVLTGASRGIGVQIARVLAARRAHLVLSARDEAGLQATAEQVRAAGGEATVVAGDVTNAEDRATLIASAVAAGDFVALVNNAGVEIPMAVVDQSDGHVETQIAVNLTAPIHLTRAALPHFLEAGRGTVVMVSSMSGKTPTPYNAIYTATKHGINGFTASLRIELRDTGVHVGTVCPSFVADAGMWADSGVPAPPMLREVSLKKVTDAVLKVLDGASEVLVTPTPVRPLLALGQIFPSIDRIALENMGVLDALRARAVWARDRYR